MKMAFHIGVHGTDDNRLLRSLKMNSQALLNEGTEVVPSERYRDILDQALMQLQGGTATREMELLLLDSLLETEAPERAVLSSYGFMGAIGRIVGAPGLYWQMGTRAARIVNLFPNHDVEIFAAIRNPAALISDMLPRMSGGNYENFMQGNAPETLRWIQPAQQLVQAMQGRRVVMWCHEDAPLIWPEIIRLIADLDPETTLKGSMLYMDELLEPQIAQQLRETLGAQDSLSISGRRAICGRFLDEHTTEDKLDQEITIPGWTQELVDQMTENYYRDVGEIAALPGVEFIMP